ncbi:hypothetical protein LTS18_009192, partial [Coniosporium uncinatum]
ERTWMSTFQDELAKMSRLTAGKVGWARGVVGGGCGGWEGREEECLGRGGRVGWWRLGIGGV